MQGKFHASWGAHLEEGAAGLHGRPPRSLRAPPVEHGKEAASPPVGHAKEAAQHLEEGGAGLHGRPAHRRWPRRRRGARRKPPSKDGGSGRPPNPTPPPQQRGESGKGRKANPRRRRRFGVPRRGPRQGKAVRPDTARRRRGPPRLCARGMRAGGIHAPRCATTRVATGTSGSSQASPSTPYRI